MSRGQRCAAQKPVTPTGGEVQRAGRCDENKIRSRSLHALAQKKTLLECSKSNGGRPGDRDCGTPGGFKGMQLGLGGTGPRPALVRRARKPRAARALGLCDKKKSASLPVEFLNPVRNPGHAPPAVAEWLQGRPARRGNNNRTYVYGGQSTARVI